jgi:hypothetical protein
MIAIKRLVKGPAAATIAGPKRLSRKLKGLYGTGFAQPNNKFVFIKTKSKGKKIVPTGSICAKGFKVSLPARRAVGSPRRSATQPCIYSCMMADKIITMKKNIPYTKLSILKKIKN